MVEVCCGEDSRISERRNCEDHDCLCIRVTIADDFTKDDTACAVINVMKAYTERVLCWFALPCTGGCPFARMNARKNHKAKQRLEGHINLFSLLWENAVTVMKEAKIWKSLTAFEWPTFCAYWQREEVWEHMREMEYSFVDFHGCMFGLQSIAKSTKGWPIKKPWSVATDCAPLLRTLNRKCLGYWHHDPATGKKQAHAECAGVNTKMTEGYTDEMAKAIHRGHRECILYGNR